MSFMSLLHERLRTIKRWTTQSITVKALGLFVGTFVASGLLVFWFEHVQGNKDQFVSFWDGIWWGIVTITTTGYGDKYPATLGGRLIAGLTMCMGIVSTGIVTGNIASWLVERRLKEGRGVLNLAHQKGHLLICGWRKEMDTVLDEILKLNPQLKSRDIVIAAPIEPEQVESLHEVPRFADVALVRGDYYTLPILERAGAKGARKVIVLADWSDPIQSSTSIDAKTVMAAMAIRKINPEVFVAAEVLDERFVEYLRIAQVDEIIRSKSVSRSLIVRGLATRGLGHVVHHLLSPETSAQLKTESLDTSWEGKSFEELKKFYSERALLIGLLENTGNIHRMKKEALITAQKNPDTRTVLRNLKEVKFIQPNRPILAPSLGYTIKKGTRAIIIAHDKEVS